MKNGLITSYDSISWYKDDKLHREDGPAVIIFSGERIWYNHGKVHRIDGPAVEGTIGDGNIILNKWYYYDIEYDESKHPFNVFRDEYDLQEEYEEWTFDMKMLFKLIYGGI